MHIDVSKLPTSAKLDPKTAFNLALLNKKKEAIAKTLNAAIEAAIAHGTNATMALDSEAAVLWDKAISDLGLQADAGWSADLKDPNNAYIVRADILNAEIQRVQALDSAEVMPKEFQDKI